MLLCKHCQLYYTDNYIVTDVQFTFYMTKNSDHAPDNKSIFYPYRKFIFAFHIYSLPSFPIHLISSVTNSEPVVVIETTVYMEFSTNICSSNTLYCHWYFIVYMLKKKKKSLDYTRMSSLCINRF